MTKGPGKTMKDTMTHRVTINSKTYIYRWIVINPIHRWTRPLVKNEILPVVFAITAIHIHVTLEELSLPTVPGKPINLQRHLWQWTTVWENFQAYSFFYQTQLANQIEFFMVIVYNNLGNIP